MPNGRGIVVIDNSAIRIWDAGFQGWTHKFIPLSPSEREPKCFALSSDGTMLLTSHFSNVVRVWNLKIGDRSNNYNFGFAGDVDLLSFCPQSKLAICLGHDSKCVVFDAGSGIVRTKLDKEALIAVALSRDEKTVVGLSSGSNKPSYFDVPPKQ